MNKKLFIVLICVSSFLVISLFAAKSPVDVAQRQNDEESPATAYNYENDEFLVVWHEDRIGDGDYNIYGRITGSDGTFKTPVFQITRNDSAQAFADADYNRLDNEYLVVWHDKRNGNWDIMAARLNMDGSKIDPQIIHKNVSDSTIIVSNQEDDQTKPKVAHNYTDNCYLVVWQDYRDADLDPIHNTDIYSQRLDKDGEILSPSITLSPSVNYPVASEEIYFAYAREQHPDVAYHGSYGTELNEWLVVFERAFMESGSRIWGTRINGPSGLHLNSFGKEFPKVYEVPLKSAFTMSMFLLPFWCEGMPLGFPEIPTDPDNPFAGSTSQYSPHVISNSVWYPFGLLKSNAEMYPIPEFLVTWTDYRNSEMGENPDIYCQRVGYFPDSTAFQMGLKPQPDADSLFTSVLLDSLGNPPVVFDNWIEWTNYPATNHPNLQSWNDLAFNQNTGEYLIVWNDWRVSEWTGITVTPMPHADIYGQRLYINPLDSDLVWIDANDNWYADPAVNMPIVNTSNDEGDKMYPGIDCGVAQNEFLIAYEFDAGADDVNEDIQATFYPDVYIPVSVDESPQSTPTEYSLANNYPNPFNPTTAIQFSVSKNSHVQLSVYDIAGRMIKTLMNETKATGSYQVSWDGTDEKGMSVSSGLYLYQLKSDGITLTRKMSLIR